MKIALPWHSQHKEHQEMADEYNITFVNKPDNFNKLIDFISDYPQRRFNIFVDTSEYDFDYRQFKVLNAISQNIYLVIPWDAREKIKDLNLKFFFNQTAPVMSFRTLEHVASFGVSDVYIMDDLCYNLKKTKAFCEAHNIQIRLIANRIPSIRPDKGTDVRSPWFVPETADELSKYIDVIEFDAGNSWARLETLCKIWKQKRWRENLRLINVDLETDIWNQSLIPVFAIFKMNCGYRCAYGSVCKKCNQFVEVAAGLHAKKIEYNLSDDIQEKEGENNGERL